MMGPRGLAAVIVLVVLITGPRPAAAVYECGGVQDTCSCSGDNFCICCYWSGLSGNCVWYGWHMACCEWGVALQWCTDANTWDSYAQQYGYTLLGTPCERTIFVCEANTTQCGAGSVGHVGWVHTAYPDGSIDVSEQGCYSFDGVQTRHFNAQSASPPMHYIYEPGVTACGQCQCSPGDVEQVACGNCGTDKRTCDGDCQWGAWSGCLNEGECAPGTTEPCGSCGGERECTDSCQWGLCIEICPDGSVPDGTVGPPDAWLAGDAGGSEPGDGGSQPGDSQLVRGGCHCRVAGNGPGLILLVVALLLWLGWRVRRGARRGRHVP